jgi:hypothetical protein
LPCQLQAPAVKQKQQLPIELCRKEAAGVDVYKAVQHDGVTAMIYIMPHRTWHVKSIQH